MLEPRGDGSQGQHHFTPVCGITKKPGRRNRPGHQDLQARPCNGSLGRGVGLDKGVDLGFGRAAVDQVLKLGIKVLMLDHLRSFLRGELGRIGCGFLKVFLADIFPGLFCRRGGLGGRNAGDVSRSNGLKGGIDLGFGRRFLGFLGKIDVGTGIGKCICCQRLCHGFGYRLDNDFLDGFFGFAGNVGDRNEGDGVIDNDKQLIAADPGRFAAILCFGDQARPNVRRRTVIDLTVGSKDLTLLEGQGGCRQWHGRNRGCGQQTGNHQSHVLGPHNPKRYLPSCIHNPAKKRASVEHIAKKGKPKY